MNIVEYMKENSLSLEEVAKRLSITPSSVKKIIYRYKNKELPLDTLSKLTNSEVYLIEKDSRLSKIFNSLLNMEEKKYYLMEEKLFTCIFEDNLSLRKEKK